MDLHSTRKLRSGNEIPVMGLGTWELKDHTADVIAKAIKLGYPMIDTSSDYGTQPGIAKALKQSGIDRADIFISAKVEETDDAYEATKKYLAEMEIDYADLMLIHRPPKTGAGEELWRGLMRAKKEGLTKDIGVSNYSIDKMDQLIAATGEVPAVNQIEWSPFGYADEMLEYGAEKRMIIQAYSPLTRETRTDDETLCDIAARHGKTPEQVLIRWNLQRGTVPIPKANNPDHLESNLQVFDFALEPSDMNALNDLNELYSSLGKLPYAA